MQIKVAMIKPNWDSGMDPEAVVFDGTMSNEDILAQLDMYILEDMHGDVSVLDFDIDIQLQTLRRA